MSKIDTSVGLFKVYFQYELELKDKSLETLDDFNDYDNVDMIYSGTTICRIFKDDKLIAFGNADCHPNDQFVKREGRKVSLTRALKQLKLSKEDRTLIWNKLFPQYFRS